MFLVALTTLILLHVVTAAFLYRYALIPAKPPRPEQPKRKRVSVPKPVPPQFPVQVNPLMLQTMLKSEMQRLLQQDSDGHIPTQERMLATMNKEFASLEQKSKVLKSIVVSKLKIGTIDTLPIIRNVHVLPTFQEHMLDFEAKMVYCGGFELELVTKLQLYTTIEATLKVSVQDLNSGISVNFSTVTETSDTGRTYPCMRLTASLKDDPTMNLDIKSVLGQFTDLSVISQIVGGAIKIVVKRLFVEPAGRRWEWKPQSGWMMVPLDKKARDIIVERRKHRNNQSSPVLGRLMITIQEAVNLANVKGGKMTGSNSSMTALLGDPYVQIQFNKQTKKTKAAPKTSDPKWLESFTLDVTDINDELVLSVFDRDRMTKDDLIGFCIIRFASVPSDVSVHYVEQLTRKQSAADEDLGLLRFDVTFERFEISQHTIPLDVPYSSGRQFVDYQYVSQESLQKQRPSVASPSMKSTSQEPIYNLIVNLKQARSLIAADKSGSSDPYCTITVGKTLKKSKVAKRTLSPVFNELISFPVAAIPLSVHIEVYNWNRFTQHTFMGKVDINLEGIEHEGLAVVVPEKLSMPHFYQVQPRDSVTVSGEVEVSFAFEMVRKTSILDRPAPSLSLEHFAPPPPLPEREEK